MDALEKNAGICCSQCITIWGEQSFFIFAFRRWLQRALDAAPLIDDGIPPRDGLLAHGIDGRCCAADAQFLQANAEGASGALS